MPYSLLVQYGTEAEYRRHFEQVYCKEPIKTFDGITVRFHKSMFDHCFFESSRRDTNKDTFSCLRSSFSPLRIFFGEGCGDLSW